MIGLLYIFPLLPFIVSQSFQSSFLPSRDTLIWTEWSEWSACRCGDSHRRRQRHCLQSTAACGACGTEWMRCPLSASSPCSVEVSDWSGWLPTQSGDAFRFRCWSQLQSNKTVVVGLRGEGRQLFTPEDTRPCSPSQYQPTTTVSPTDECFFLYVPLTLCFLMGLSVGVVITVIFTRVFHYWRERKSNSKRFDISQYSFVADRKWFI